MAVQIEVPRALGQQFARSNQPIPQPITEVALIDTGATISAVHAPLIQQLGVAPVGVAKTGTAGGQHQQNLYPLRIGLTELTETIDYNQVLGADLSGTGFIALLGRDLLQNMILIYDGPSSEFTISY